MSEELRGQLSGPSGPGSNPALDFVRKLKKEPKTWLTHKKRRVTEHLSDGSINLVAYFKEFILL